MHYSPFLPTPFKLQRLVCKEPTGKEQSRLFTSLLVPDKAADYIIFTSSWLHAKPLFHCFVLFFLYLFTSWPQPSPSHENGLRSVPDGARMFTWLKGLHLSEPLPGNTALSSFVAWSGWSTCEVATYLLPSVAGVKTIPSPTTHAYSHLIKITEKHATVRAQQRLD